MQVDLDEDLNTRPDHIDYRHEKELIEFERLYLEQRAKKTGHNDSNVVGLALSGGGIRSASFSLGVMQALARSDVFKQVDYLSTVSGGGYIGSSLTWFLSKQWDYGNGIKPNFGMGKDDFPFGTAPNTHSDVPSSGSQEKMSILRHLRQNLNYLFPGDGINLAALFAVLLRGIFFNLFIYFPIIILLLMLLSLVVGLFVQECEQPIQMDNLDTLAWVAGGLFALSLVAGVLYGLVCSLARIFPRFLYWFRLVYQKVAGYMLVFAGITLLLSTLPFVYEFLPKLFDIDWLNAMGITLGGVLSGVWAYMRSGNNEKTKSKIPTGLIITASAALLLYGFVLLGYETAYKFEEFINKAIENEEYIVALFFIIPAIIGLFINVNFITLHRYYRDRLMELFMPVPKKATINKPAHPAYEANGSYVHEMCNYFNGAVGPYHLINTNIMLPGSKITKFRGRGGDNFIVSPLYCGSNATGWQRSDKYIDGKFTFPTAMAVSGAAVNPNTGAGGEGPTRNPLLSAIMGFLNFRLGLWVENPKLVNPTRYLRPNMWLPGLRDIFLPKFMNENSRFVELSDGGHFENLGAYELIRREVELIIICDGAADKNCRFGDFANLVEKVRLDFGARIDIDLEPLIPKKGTNLPYGLKKIAKEGNAIGTIEYRNNKIGLLVYLKTTVVPDLPADIYGYKLTHDDFPDETTADQLFDEKQFEAYRELGFQLGKRMLYSLPAKLDKLLEKHAQFVQWALIRFNIR